MAFLRHQPNDCSCSAVVSHGVVTIGYDGSGRGINDAADDANQCRLACTIRSQQGEYFAAFYLHVDFLSAWKPLAYVLLTPRTMMMGSEFSAVMVVGFVFMGEGNTG